MRHVTPQCVGNRCRQFGYAITFEQISQRANCPPQRLAAFGGLGQQFPTGRHRLHQMIRGAMRTGLMFVFNQGRDVFGPLDLLPPIEAAGMRGDHRLTIENSGRDPDWRSR